MERRDVVDYMYLAKTTSLDQLIPIIYILFLTEMQKRKTLLKGFALLKNDITGSEPASKFNIHCSNMQLRSKNWHG